MSTPRIVSGLRNPRALLAAGVIMAGFAAVALAILVGGASEAGPDRPLRTVRSQLTLERFRSPATGQPELLVSLPDQRLNTLQTTRGESSVLLRCTDETGAETIRQRWEWPLLEEAGYPSPHIHQPARREVLNNIRGCRLSGTGIDFTGRVPGRLPAAQ